MSCCTLTASRFKSVLSLSRSSSSASVSVSRSFSRVMLSGTSALFSMSRLTARTKASLFLQRPCGPARPRSVRQAGCCASHAFRHLLPLGSGAIPWSSRPVPSPRLHPLQSAGLPDASGMLQGRRVSLHQPAPSSGTPSSMRYWRQCTGEAG